MAQKTHADNFQRFLQSLVENIQPAKSGIYSVPSENELYDWNKVISCFRSLEFDSCKMVLSRNNYELIQLKDGLTGDQYDIIREKLPIKNGWGTYIYNRNHKKRLYIHINHPLDDENALVVGSEMFRQLKGEWLLIGGTSRHVQFGKPQTDVGRMKRSVFERVHETLSDLTHITLSIHSYDENKLQYPISVTDVIISNGKTTDDQWGISQISLALRDTLKTAGFRCSLAMYDSGFAKLAGGWNSQGTFSNDSVGFGHWLYVELSKNVRHNPAGYAKLISTIDRALDLTGKKISQQVNRAFGLVSPRVIRVDSVHRLFFPPESAGMYRIVSFNPNGSKSDTLEVRMGSLMELFRSKKTISSVTVLDTAAVGLGKKLMKPNRPSSTTAVTRIINPTNSMSSMIQFSEEPPIDSSIVEDGDENSKEPIQVHRIPLKPILQQTYYTDVSSGANQYKWKGILPAGYIPNITLFEINSNPAITDEWGGLPKFFIPLTSSSYRTEKGGFIGIQMTNILISEIARLITEYNVADKDIGFMAEQSEQGDYYLRIIPSSPTAGSNIP